jgi:basic amino acid/polyamine antiporter, APA family
MQQDPDRLLVRGLGLRQLTAHIFNYTVGSGIFVLPAVAVAQLGTAAPLAYVVCAVVMALVVMIFAEAGSRVTVTGGPYAYVEAGLGPFLGFVTGILLAAAQMSAGGAIAALVGESVARLLGIESAPASKIITALLMAALVYVNVRGLRLGARVVELSTAAKLVPLVFFIVAGAWFIVPENLHIAAWPEASRVATTSGTLIFAFIGIESALTPTGEIRDPSRTVPRAAMLALTGATLLYLAVQTVALGVLGPLLGADTVAPLASATSIFAGDAGATFLLAGATISMLGWVTGSVLAAPRTIFAFARNGYLPRGLAAVHSQYHTPHAAIIAYGVLVVAMSWTGTFQELAVLANLSALGVFALTACAVVALRRKNVRAENPPWLMPGGLSVPAVTCVLIAWIAVQTVSRREFVAFAAVWAISLAVYVVRRLGGARAG